MVTTMFNKAVLSGCVLALSLLFTGCMAAANDNDNEPIKLAGNNFIIESELGWGSGAQSGFFSPSSGKKVRLLGFGDAVANSTNGLGYERVLKSVKIGNTPIEFFSNINFRSTSIIEIRMIQYKIANYSHTISHNYGIRLNPFEKHSFKFSFGLDYVSQKIKPTNVLEGIESSLTRTISDKRLVPSIGIHHEYKLCGPVHLFYGTYLKFNNYKVKPTQMHTFAKKTGSVSVGMIFKF